MRKSIIPMAVAIVTTLGLPAYAAKYTCDFAKDGNPVGQQCSIDPMTTNSSCAQSLGGNLSAFCVALKSEDDKIEGLLCGFGTPSNVADAMKSPLGRDSVATFRTLAEKPGFAAENFVVFPTASRPNFGALAYRESQSAPVFTAVCQ